MVAGLLRRHGRVSAIAMASAMIGPVASFGIPAAAQIVIDEIVARGKSGLIMPVALGASAAVVLQAAALYLGARASSLLSHRVSAELRRRLTDHAFCLRLAHLDSVPAASTVARLTEDVDNLRGLLGPELFQLLSAALTASLALAVLIRLEWRLTVLTVGLLAIASHLIYRRFLSIQPTFAAVAQQRATLAGRLAEVIGSMRLVMSCAAERAELLSLARVGHEVIRSSVAAERQIAALACLVTVVGGGLTTMILGVGSQLVLQEQLSLGELALFLLVAGLLLNPLLQVAGMAQEIGRGRAAVHRIEAFLAQPKQPSAGTRVSRRVAGTVSCRALTYAYGTGRCALRNINLDVARDTVLAVTGPNGAGKSTLLSLIAGFEDPTEGFILVDDRPITSLDRISYRRQVGVILQREQLLTGTVAENIGYGCHGVTAADVRRAARLAHCEAFIEALPKGYGTMVGERGVRLSGGERQRVALARLWLLDPRIVLLDEPWAHLDADAGILTRAALATLCEGRTTIVVAHDLTNGIRPDQVVFLDQGRVVASGSPEDLLPRISSVQFQSGRGKHVST